MDTLKRANNCCELCQSDENISIYQVFNDEGGDIVLCSKCLAEVENENFSDDMENHLNSSMWSEVPVVKILSYKILKKIGRNDLVDMIYLTPEEQKIADFEKEVVKDAFGNILKDGDDVSVVKDLDVKGTGKTIKRGTVAKNIRMCDVAGHIACKVDGFGAIYLKTEFLKKI